jgi:hypothetical protein
MTQYLNQILTIEECWKIGQRWIGECNNSMHSIGMPSTCTKSHWSILYNFHSFPFVYIFLKAIPTL